MITVCSGPDCMQCRATYKASDAKGLTCQVVDVADNAAALEYIKDLGYLTASVVVVSGHDRWGGFRPDCIDRVAGVRRHDPGRARVGVERTGATHRRSRFMAGWGDCQPALDDLNYEAHRLYRGAFDHRDCPSWKGRKHGFPNIR